MLVACTVCMYLPNKSLVWIGNSKQDYSKFPAVVQDDMGFALYQAQLGMHPSIAKPLKGFGGAKVIELVGRYAGNAFRAVYAVEFDGVICVLHCFEKKSPTGRSMSKADRDAIQRSLALATKEYGK